MRRLLGAVSLVIAHAAMTMATAQAQGPLSPKIPPAPVATTAVPNPSPVTPPVTTPTPPIGGSTAATTGTGVSGTAGVSTPSPMTAPSTAPGAGGGAPLSSAGPGLAPVKKDEPEPKVSPNVYTLPQCLALALGRAAQIKMSEDRLTMAHAQLDEVTWIPWSQWSLSGGIAMVPEIRGTSVYSPNGDISISSKLGPAWRVGIEGVVPLWTFGKITAGVAAAKSAVGVALADVDKTKNLIKHDVRRAYFGLQLAHSARYLLTFAKDKLEDAVNKAEENEDTDEADLLRMKTYQMEISARLGEVEKGERIATAGLRFLTGLEAPHAFEIPDEPIAPPKKPLVDILVYLKSARIHRPELKMVKSGVEGRSAQVDFARARLYPDIGLGLAFGYANAPIITDQTNPFVVDNANFLRYGFGIVFRWNMDLLPAAARVRYAQAQLDEMRETEKYALGGVAVEVETAYAVAKDAATREKFYGEAETLSKRWVASVTAAIGIGTKEERDIIDPLRAFLTNRYNHLQAVMDLDVALSQLSLATGDDSVAEY